jgi:hypothetical protein
VADRLQTSDYCEDPYYTNVTATNHSYRSEQPPSDMSRVPVRQIHAEITGFLVIIICNTTLFELQSFLDNSTRFDPFFTSLDCTTIILLQSKLFSLVSNSKPGGPGLCIYIAQ